MTTEYCLVEGGVIVDGPKDIPKSWKNITGFYKLDNTQLKNYGWLPYNNSSPDYNLDTQYLTSIKVITSDAVNETYTINNYTEEQLVLILTEKKNKIFTQINADVNYYINKYYDTGTQQSFTGLYTKRNTPDSVRDYIDPVWTWISSIMIYYYSKKTEITNAVNITILKAITWDFSTFDATKPNVNLQTLMNSM